jgi:hypothetical protein
MNEWNDYLDAREAEFKHRQETRKYRKARTERRELEKARRESRRASV